MTIKYTDAINILMDMYDYEKNDHRRQALQIGSKAIFALYNVQLDDISNKPKHPSGPSIRIRKETDVE